MGKGSKTRVTVSADSAGIGMAFGLALPYFFQHPPSTPDGARACAAALGELIEREEANGAPASAIQFLRALERAMEIHAGLHEGVTGAF